MADLIFPQLSSGAIAQFPFRKSKRYHVAKNVTEDGHTYAYFDPTSGKVFWNLPLTNLTAVEAGQINNLFRQCRGKWVPFLFMDPTDNLFSDSVDLTSPSWLVAPEVAVTGGMADPQGQANAFQIINRSQVANTVSQALTAPPNLTFAFSAFVRSDSSASAFIVRRGNTEEILEEISFSSQWMRVQSKQQLAQPGSSVTFGFQLQPGQQFQVFGPQCEAQPAPSEAYRPTYGSGGLYPNAYFAMDTLTISANAPGQYSTTLSIEATR